MIEIRNYEFVTVTGPDAKAFLQGQVTCDVEKLSENSALAGAICNLKGRVIADFLLVLDGEDCVLRTQSGMAGIIKNTLAKYAIFSKVELSTETRFTKVLGAMTDEDEAFLTKTSKRYPKTASLAISVLRQFLFASPGKISVLRFGFTMKNDSKTGESITTLTQRRAGIKKIYCKGSFTSAPN